MEFIPNRIGAEHPRNKTGRSWVLEPTLSQTTYDGVVIFAWRCSDTPEEIIVSAQSSGGNIYSFYGFKVHSSDPSLWLECIPFEEEEHK